jgi:hypothetical protein
LAKAGISEKSAHTRRSFRTWQRIRGIARIAR